MKQHITIEQLNELSEKGKERLREWWNKTQTTKDGEKWENGISNIVCLSIGQMLEFLDESGHTFYSINTQENNGKREFFMISYKKSSIKQALNGHRTELCDALWEAVKEILEQ